MQLQLQAANTASQRGACKLEIAGRQRHRRQALAPPPPLGLSSCGPRRPGALLLTLGGGRSGGGGGGGGHAQAGCAGSLHLLLGRGARRQAAHGGPGHPDGGPGHALGPPGGQGDACPSCGARDHRHRCRGSCWGPGIPAASELITGWTSRGRPWSSLPLDLQVPPSVCPACCAPLRLACRDQMGVRAPSVRHRPQQPAKSTTAEQVVPPPPCSPPVALTSWEQPPAQRGGVSAPWQSRPVHTWP